MFFAAEAVTGNDAAAIIVNNAVVMFIYLSQVVGFVGETFQQNFI
ncbi:hypothetical Protein YC6258_00088 [Gynuella sunshinyii YC6258]|uniref:Uncharacterized protein n=1 Tax=Gynuella sunshinyii YC6258 TaxID=1445510 RepID=A0A0C5UXW3_9GAMM|nr:hypothetical Protein YC6258_00088 [Gynuella sunshinyii YC6258]